jgi:predicted lipoprotein with Yx(FWY)xxD motif
MNTMKKISTCAAVCGLLAFLVLPVAAMHHEVKIAEPSGLGKYLTDTQGMALYMFKQDSPGHSACSGGCVANWPLFYREKVVPPRGLASDDFGTISREDGAMQTTFRGYPLYYFKEDKKPGDTKGNGMMDVWYLIDPDDFPSE